jgi:hypothetical protein
MPSHVEPGWQAGILNTGEQDCIIFLRSLGTPLQHHNEDAVRNATSWPLGPSDLSSKNGRFEAMYASCSESANQAVRPVPRDDTMIVVGHCPVEVPRPVHSS